MNCILSFDQMLLIYYYRRRKITRRGWAERRAKLRYHVCVMKLKTRETAGFSEWAIQQSGGCINCILIPILTIISKRLPRITRTACIYYSRQDRFNSLDQYHVLRVLYVRVAHYKWSNLDICRVVVFFQNTLPMKF